MKQFSRRRLRYLLNQRKHYHLKDGQQLGSPPLWIIYSEGTFTDLARQSLCLVWSLHWCAIYTSDAAVLYCFGIGTDLRTSRR